MKLLLRFTKEPSVRFISHLDMQRLFQRALRRAKLPCAYSQGFNPHTLVSFAAALPVGVCSSAEYVEAVMERYVSPADAMTRLNAVLPMGVRVTAAGESKESDPALGGLLALAEYRLAGEAAQEALDAILAKDELMIEKKTKKGPAKVNVRPMIHRLRARDGQVWATLSCAQENNLRVDKLAELLASEGITVSAPERTAVFVLRDGRLFEPLEVEK